MPQRIILISGVILVASLIIRTCYRKLVSRASKPLPGPWNYPLLGNIFQLGLHKPYKALTRMATRYGDVFRVHLLSTPVVVLCKQDAMKEAFAGQSVVFAGRPLYPSWQKISNGHSLSFRSFSDCWSLQKNLVHQALLQYHQATSKPLEVLLDHHADALIARLQHEAVADPYSATMDCITNVIFTMLFGEGASDDKVAGIILKTLDEFKEISPQIQIADSMPMIASLFMRKTLQKVDHTTEAMAHAITAWVSAYRKHRYNGDIRTVADAFINVSMQIPEAGLANGLTREYFLDSLHDIIGASLETTVHTLYFAVRYMLQHPDVQARVQHDIDSVLGPDVPVSWEHRSKLAYVRATLTEILRHSCVLPLTIPHCTTQDTVFRGHAIAKGTMVFGNIYSASFDEQVWESPHQFLPERFLTASGEFAEEQARKLCVFGLGRRACPGKAIANKILFVTFGKLMQQCNISAATTFVDDVNFSLTLCPLPYIATIVKR